jgi:hypothetical protein
MMMADGRAGEVIHRPGIKGRVIHRAGMLVVLLDETWDARVMGLEIPAGNRELLVG